MPPTPSTSARARSTAVAALCAALGVLSGSGVPLVGQSLPQAAPPAMETPEPVIPLEQTSTYRVAVAALERLEENDGTLSSRQELLARNLSRYFAIYNVPEVADELQRVLGTAQRMSEQAALLFFGASRALAEQERAPAIRRAHVRAATDRLLPRRTNEWEEIVYFPRVEPTPLETWDLQAFLDVGLAWEVLASLAEVEATPQGPLLQLEEDAAAELVSAINAYGLLLFRLAGEHARAELAPHVRTDHLRSAGKTIASRAGGDPARILERPAPAATGSHFTDVTAGSGLDFRHVTADWLSHFRRYGSIAPTFSGSGAAAADVDGDDWEDIVLCGGLGCALYRADRTGSFVDATATAGIAVEGEARQPVLADFDNDGHKDLFVTYARDTNRIFRNRGDGTFEDVTTGSGLESPGLIGGPATVFDYDGDGWLDIYVGNFGNYLEGASAWVSLDAKNAEPNRLYRNLTGENPTGPLRFEDVTERAGVGDLGWTQALSHLDYDGDGHQDLYVANDFGRNQLYRNRGDGTFEALGETTASDDPHHGMNVAMADLNRDERPDIFVTNIWFWAAAKRAVTETNTLLLSTIQDGRPAFRRVEDPGLLGPDSGWSWAGVFFDADHDGDDDLYVANGFTDYMTFVQYRPHPERPDQLYPIHNARDPNLLFLNPGGSDGIPNALVEGSGAELAGLNSRSVVLLDYDRDGDLDLLVTTFHDRPRLLRNDAARGNWLHLTLEGDPERRSNRDAIGAVVIARGGEAAPDLYVWRMVTGGEGYLGQHSPAVHMGLGAASAVDLEIRWPNGDRQSLRGVRANRSLRLRQGAQEAEVVWAPGDAGGTR
jgi:enediyne biosynthesis protein E4